MSYDDLEFQLIQAAKEGDRSSLSQLLLLHYDSLRRYLASRISADLQGLLRAEDVLHQTLVRAARMVSSFEPHHAGSFRAWLRTIADNLLKDAEKRRRRERRAGDPLPGRAGSSIAVLMDRLAGDGTTPSGQVQRRDATRCMQAALASLPAEQREVLERYYLKEQSLDQIAEAMDRTRDAVRGVCYRARRNLRALMGRSSLYFSG